MGKLQKVGEKIIVRKNNWGLNKRTIIILLVIAFSIIILGIYLSQSGLLKRNDISLYNQGISSYYLSTNALLPATDDRPSEYSIDRSIAYFVKVVIESDDGELKALALYNLGTIMGKDILEGAPRYDITEAINKIKESIRLNPNNEHAKYNLEFLEKAYVAFGTPSIPQLADVPALDEREGSKAGQINKGY